MRLATRHDGRNFFAELKRSNFRKVALMSWLEDDAQESPKA